MTIHTCLVHGCRGKLRYASKQMARKAARRVVTTMGGAPMEPYRCHCCTKIHIGHSNRTRRS